MHPHPIVVEYLVAMELVSFFALFGAVAVFSFLVLGNEVFVVVPFFSIILVESS